MWSLWHCVVAAKSRKDGLIMCHPKWALLLQSGCRMSDVSNFWTCLQTQGVAIGKVISWSFKNGIRRHLSGDQCDFTESPDQNLAVYCMWIGSSLMLVSSRSWHYTTTIVFGEVTLPDLREFNSIWHLQELLFGLLDYDHDKLLKQSQRKVLYQDTQCTVWHCHISYGCALWMEVLGNIVSFTTRIFLSNLTSFGMPIMMWLLAFKCVLLPRECF